MLKETYTNPLELINQVKLKWKTILFLFMTNLNAGVIYVDHVLYSTVVTGL